MNYTQLRDVELETWKPEATTQSIRDRKYSKRFIRLLNWTKSCYNISLLLLDGAAYEDLRRSELIDDCELFFSSIYILIWIILACMSFCFGFGIILGKLNVKVRLSQLRIYFKFHVGIQIRIFYWFFDDSIHERCYEFGMQYCDDLSSSAHALRHFCVSVQVREL